uniref:Uncharacterized protein n=1 Tax=Anguilla anguilla TaxID=7936 RepID=A0A0E9Q0U4_ANGAN
MFSAKSPDTSCCKNL